MRQRRPNAPLYEGVNDGISAAEFDAFTPVTLSDVASSSLWNEDSEGRYLAWRRRSELRTTHPQHIEDVVQALLLGLRVALAKLDGLAESQLEPALRRQG